MYHIIYHFDINNNYEYNWHKKKIIVTLFYSIILFKL